jgi:hypothetical protein
MARLSRGIMGLAPRLPATQPNPSPASKLDRRRTGRQRKRDDMLMVTGEVGRGE